MQKKHEKYLMQVKAEYEQVLQTSQAFTEKLLLDKKELNEKLETIINKHEHMIKEKDEFIAKMDMEFERRLAQAKESWNIQEKAKR